MLFGLVIPCLVNTILKLWYSIDWFELMLRMSLAGLIIYSCWICIPDMHSCVFHTVTFTILLFINPTLQMVNWSDEVIVSGTLKNPAYLLLLQKGKMQYVWYHQTLWSTNTIEAMRTPSLMLLLPFAQENPKTWSNFYSTNLIWLYLHIVVLSLLKSWQPEIGVLLWLWTSGHPRMEPAMLINSSSTQCLVLYCHNSLKAVKAIPLSVKFPASMWLEYCSIRISCSSLALIYLKRKFNCS